MLKNAVWREHRKSASPFTTRSLPSTWWVPARVFHAVRSRAREILTVEHGLCTPSGSECLCLRLKPASGRDREPGIPRTALRLKIQEVTVPLRSLILRCQPVEVFGLDILNRAGRDGPNAPVGQQILDGLLAEPVTLADVANRPAADKIQLNDALLRMARGRFHESRYLCRKSHKVSPDRDTE
jgi:hypothetical protein